MKRTYKVVMICSNGDEVVLDRCRNIETAERKVRIYEQEDACEIREGYFVPSTRYIIK